jgi:hypothetical protein
MVDLKDIHKYIKHKLMIFISFISDIPINIFIQVYILSIDSLSDSSKVKKKELCSDLGVIPMFLNFKKGALDSQPQVIKLTSCLPAVGSSLRVQRLLPPLKLVAMI